jgi:hypothetical protein
MFKVVNDYQGKLRYEEPKLVDLKNHKEREDPYWQLTLSFLIAILAA